MFHISNDERIQFVQ